MKSKSKRCDGCGRNFRPMLDGSLCPTCVDVIQREGLNEKDWQQHELLEEYDP